MHIPIKKEYENKQLDNLLIDLYNENEPNYTKDINFHTYDIDKDVINYILAKYNPDDTEIVDITKNIYKFLDNNKKNNYIYLDVRGENLETFLSSTVVRKIGNIIAFHLIRQAIVGKKNSLDYKLAFRKLADEFSTNIATEEEDKYILAQEISLCIVAYNPKQTLENINLIDPAFKKATYIRKDNRLVQTNTFNKKEFFKVVDDFLIKISINNGKIQIEEYELTSNKISDIELDKLKTYGVFKNRDYKNYKDFDIEKFTNNIKTKVYDLYIKIYGNYLKIPTGTYQKNEYRDKIVISVYKILKSEFNDASTHVLSIISGFISAELGLLNSKDEHSDSSYKYPYSQYLNKTVINILNKAEIT